MYKNAPELIWSYKSSDERILRVEINGFVS